ncbi:NAD(P)-binding protein [Pseudonocardia thermophila]|uniref:NAD(P)-binding protein n=1 Tax=Pseudonocardia thermophila TaxID=1848 RepID=UPI001F444F6D|nr:NAD(P)-binding protein [Pseudonocardia thermophila]
MGIVVVGAGVGGLVTALELHRASIPVTVLEQRGARGDSGLGIKPAAALGARAGGP